MKEYWNGLSSAEKTKYIIYTIISIVVLIFVIRNWQPTTFHIFFTKIQLPTTVLIFFSMLAGFGFAKFMSIRKTSELKKQINQLRDKVVEHNEQANKRATTKGISQNEDSEAVG